MRKFLAFALVSYLTTFWAPFVTLAVDSDPTDEYASDAESCVYTGLNCDEVSEEEMAAAETAADEREAAESTSTPATAAEKENDIDPPNKMCPFGIQLPYGSTEEYKKDQYKQANELETLMYELEFSTDEGKDSNTCGQPNNYSGYLEKGDCSADGLIVTEITEVIAPDVDLEDNKIITVYAGLCCFAGEVDETSGKVITCDDTRTIYTSTDEGGSGFDKCNAVAENCDKRQWVIGSSGIGVVKLMVKQVFTFGALAVGSIAVFTMVFQGIKISVSGVSGDISESKNKILQALSGIVLLFLSGLILYTINPGFFG